jgi:hypothetical protein
VAQHVSFNVIVVIVVIRAGDDGKKKSVSRAATQMRTLESVGLDRKNIAQFRF